MFNSLLISKIRKLEPKPQAIVSKTGAKIIHECML